MTMSGDPPSSIITLLTDFGLVDSYVAAVKGVLLRINPRAQIVDISHGIALGQVRQACFIAQGAWTFFSTETIHIAIVDPGVGTDRRAIALRSERGTFLGPDNGVLSAAISDDDRAKAVGTQTVLPMGCSAVSITNRRYAVTPVSATFHGRDIFAPAAAHLSLGIALEELGERIDSMILLPPIRAARNADGSIVGHVIHVDHFGNLITDIRHADVPWQTLITEIDGRIISPVAVYAGAVGLSVIPGSGGYLEIALSGGNAASELDAKEGTPVLLRPA